jgi:hypothetical protein
MIKRGNLSTSLKTWLMSTLQLGPGIGDVFYLCPTASATSNYQQWLVNQGVDGAHMFTDLPTAYAALTGDRNDVLCVLPGTYTQTARVTWALNSTHLVGLGSPNQRIPATAGTAGCVYFPCVTAMTEEFLITGHHCQFHNFSTYLSTATGIADVRVQGRNTLLKGLFMKSGQTQTQFESAVLGYSLFCDGGAAGYCNGLTVEDCHIGDPRNSQAGDGVTPRTAGGMILMTGASNAGMCYEFKRNIIAGWAETAACSAVFQVGNWSADRYILWEDCLFYNFYVNNGAILTQVFTDTSASTHMNLLTGKTAQYGWGKWTNRDANCFIGIPIASGTGGTALIATG